MHLQFVPRLANVHKHYHDNGNMVIHVAIFFAKRENRVTQLVQTTTPKSERLPHILVVVDDFVSFFAGF